MPLTARPSTRLANTLRSSGTPAAAGLAQSLSSLRCSTSWATALPRQDPFHTSFTAFGPLSCQRKELPPATALPPVYVCRLEWLDLLPLLTQSCCCPTRRFNEAEQSSLTVCADCGWSRQHLLNQSYTDQAVSIPFKEQ